MEETLYTIFKYGNRNLLAIPTKYKKNANQFYKGDTIKRRIIKMIMRILTKFNLEQLISVESENPILDNSDFNFSKWLNRVEQELKKNNLEAIVNFPAQSDRKRFYVDLFVEGKKIGFSKVSLDDENDQQLLNESNKTANLLLNSYTFKIPKVQVEGLYDGHRYLVYEPLPQVENQMSGTWDTLFKVISNELSQNTIKHKKIIELNWWTKLNDYLTNTEIDMFLKNIELNVSSVVEICLAHGDLHNGNVVINNNEIWIFDWEASNYDSPILTDEVAHFLATNQKLFVKDKEVLISKLQKNFKFNDINTRQNVLMALAFLTTTGREDSKEIIKQLNHYDIYSGLYSYF